MFPSWRIRLHEARRALDRGQLDQASQIVADRELREFRQAKELSAEIATGIVERARGRIEAGQTSAGWRDVELARQIAGNDSSAELPAVESVEQDLAEQSLDRAVQLLTSGQSTAARQQLRKLATRKLGGQQRQRLEALTDHLLSGERSLAEGNSAAARQSIAAAAQISVEPELAALCKINATDSGKDSTITQRIEAITQQCEQHLVESQQLLSALEAKSWREVLNLADRLICLAPRDKVALSARRQAWRAAGLEATQLHRPDKSGKALLALNDTHKAGDTPHDINSPHDTMSASEPANRFFVWVDSVGGYLVCTDDEVVLGQPAPGQEIAVPIRADLSRRHAILRREANGYTLEPLGTVRVDGQPVTSPVALGSEHEIQLGESVRLIFQKPHALSGTARLTLASNHRTAPRSDAVLLMADSCVMGPKSHCHIQCRKWPGDVILFRHGQQLSCRSSSPLTVDGVTAEGPTPLDFGTRVEGEDFALSLEAVG